MSTPRRTSPRLDQVKEEETRKRKATNNGLSLYEIKRLENIARNKKVLASLGLMGAKRELSHAISTKKPRIATLGVASIKRKKPRTRKPKLPPRRSNRVAGKDSDGKELPPNFKEPSKFGHSGGYDEPKEEKLSIQGNVEVDEDGKTFLQSLKMALNKGSSSSKFSSSSSSSSSSDNNNGGKRRSHRIKTNSEMDVNHADFHGYQKDGGNNKGVSKNDDDDDETVNINGDLLDYAERLSELSVDEIQGVRRLTKDRIYSLDISPSSSQICIAAGDKFGRFGLWAVGSTGGTGQTGVFNARPHNATCIDVKFNPVDPSKVYTSSYDGRIMVLDANQTKFHEMYSGDVSFYEMELKHDMSTMFAAREDGGLTQFDLRSKCKVVNEWDLHEKKINTISLNPVNEQYLTTASLDRSCGIWDLRSMKKPLHNLPHALSLNHAAWSPDGRYITTVCQDNYLRTYDAPYLCENPHKSGFPEQAKYKVRHDNRTGRWLTKFKIHWDPKQSDAFVIGSMDQPRCIEVFNAECQRIMRMREDGIVKSVQSLNVFHKSKDIIAGANASGKVYLWKK